MDGDRFDALLRAFSKPPTRRDALRLLTGSALGSLLGLEQLKMKAKKGKGKGHGKGKGKGKGGNKKCKNKGKTTICHKGETISVSNCSLKAHQKHGDALADCCAALPDISACGGGRKCSGGVCTVEPSCLGTGETCGGTTSCCDGITVCNPVGVCQTGAAGMPCHLDTDCTSNDCMGFTCQA